MIRFTCFMNLISSIHGSDSTIWPLSKLISRFTVFWGLLDATVTQTIVSLFWTISEQQGNANIVNFCRWQVFSPNAWSRRPCPFPQHTCTADPSISGCSFEKPLAPFHPVVPGTSAYLWKNKSKEIVTVADCLARLNWGVMSLPQRSHEKWSHHIHGLWDSVLEE